MADWLTHYLKRIPADEALLRASEARVIDGVSLAEPTLDLRDDFGRGTQPIERGHTPFSSVIDVQTHDDADLPSERLTKIHQALEPDGTLLLFLATSRPPAEIIQQLNKAGFDVERWQRHYSRQQQLTAASLAGPWPQHLYKLTGHYVPLPWPSLIEQAHERLRPVYNIATPPELGEHAVFLARKRAADAPVQPHAAPLMAVGSVSTHNELPQAPQFSAEQLVRLESLAQRSSRSAPDIKRAVLPLLAGGMLLFGWLAQGAMQANNAQPGSGLTWLLLALLCMLGIRTAADWGTSSPAASHNKGAWLNWAMLIGTIGLTTTLSTVAWRQSDNPLIALPAWLLAIIGTIIVLRGEPARADDSGAAEREEDAILSADRPNRWTPLILPALIVILALFVRLANLTSHPWVINGIEAQLGLEAMATRDVFSTGWLTNPTLPLFLTKGMLAVFGRTPLALRLLSPFIGAATVALTYMIGRRLWNRSVGVVAAALLAASHTHIHYSRLGMTNIWDPFVAIGTMGMLGVAWHSGQRRHWLAAGLFGGLSFYVFTAAHLVPLMLAVVFTLALTNAPTKQQRHNIIAALTTTIVSALPQIRVYLEAPDLYFERANVLGIFQNGWLTNQLAAEQTVSAVLSQQLWRAALGFTAVNDLDGVYNPGTPMLSSLTGLLVLLGLGMAIFHLKQARYATLLLTWLVTIVFAGALLVDVPHSRRLLITLPALLLLGARALVWTVEKVESAWRVSAENTTNPAPIKVSTGNVIISAVILFVALTNVNFYFGSYQTSHRFADRNTEIAHAVSDYLNTLDESWTVYFYGQPSMYTSFSTIPFLANNFQEGINLHNAAIDQPLANAISPNTAHIFIPDTFAALANVQEALPGGEVNAIEGFTADPLIVTYEIQP